MEEKIERGGLEQQIELLRFRSSRIIRYFDQRVPLQLCLGFEAPISKWPLAGDLEPLVTRFALGTTGLPWRRIRFE